MLCFQADTRFCELAECIGSEAPPKSSRVELHMPFRDLDRGHSVAAGVAQFHL